ncbi:MULTISPECIES: chromosome segregation protein SMC [Caproicibacterium]|uniref:Chromosome partition protein Smc n=1 Tax=Caproicibacterium argilliputei TaxID=3030016 RepID=A0AA97DDA4_9FIRM|nr:chromosome segregation protein SMC [Caproicibacterium argilliputei]WOC33415.1 chromosome segregation protein SMC [Caproicibacterium argilliputei]
MLIRSLEIQGFKTFPDKTVLQFNRGITAVVGPNGSGKSNISDAVRWVLGEQSVKTLRCTKMEDVIFNGTPQRKAQGFAEVTLNIDNRDRQLPFDKDEVAVTRRYYRSGESEYLINKAAVRLRDVNELFMDTGLGRDGYSVIGQGRIDAIVSARSEDRREIFEEAAGISRYRYRKAESEHRLDAAEENLLRLRDILTELEGRVAPLKEQSEKAQQFLTLSEEKKGLELALWLHTLEQSAQTLHQYDDKLTLARTQQDAAEKACAALDKSAEENFHQMTDCAAQIDRVRQESSACEETAAKKDGEADVLCSEVRHAEETVLRLQTELSLSSQDHTRLTEEAAQKEAQIAASATKAEQHRQQIAAFEQKLEDLRAQMNQNSDKAETLSRRLSTLSAQATESKVAEMTAASAIGEIGMRVSQTAEAIAEKETLLAQLQKSKKASTQMLSEMEERVGKLQNAERGFELRLQTHRKKAESCRQEADRLSLDAKESFRRAELLEALERNMEGFHKSVKVVMQEAQRGALPGVHGPVSRLLTVPDAYAVALETALGTSMQHLVVGTEEDAKRAIQVLKRRDSGRATFLPLSTVRGRVLQEPGLKQCAGYVGIASELCTSEACYRGIRESLLGRIAVAEDLDAAVEIARKFHYRFRIVTLDGQVVNAGGSLTGGSLARNSGLLSRRGEITRIQSKAQAQQKEADEAAAALKNCQQQLADDETELVAARRELAGAQEDRIHMAADREQLLKDLAGTEQDLQTLCAERESASQRLAQQKRLQEEARRKSADTQAQVAALRAESAALSDSRGEFNRQSDAYIAQIQEERLQMLAAEKDLESQRTALQELQDRAKSSTDRADTLTAQLAQEKDRIASLKSETAAVRAQAKALRQQAAESSTKIEQIQARRMQLEQQNTLLRQQQRDKGVEKENLAQESARLEERRESLQKQYDGIASKLWEEYELTRREAEPLAAKIDNLPRAQRRLNELKGLIRALGTVNVAAIDEYKEVSERYEFLSAQIQDVEKSREELRQLIRELTQQMCQQFAQSFAQIGSNFTETFRELFGGGTASLALTNPEDILASGIEITVQPPGKIVSHLESLSGGEKALVAIALYFAIMKVSPPPFCMLDEIEAALDDVNVTRFASYLRRMTRNTQFIVITHRRGSMEEADMLYGVTMQDEGISKILVLHPNEIANYH